MTQLISKELVSFTDQERERILVLTAQQVNKDARRIWVDIDAFRESGYAIEVLLKEVCHGVDELRAHSVESFASCLYRFDIDEREAMKALENQTQNNDVALLLLRRALKKVLFRRHYEA